VDRTPSKSPSDRKLMTLFSVPPPPRVLSSLCREHPFLFKSAFQKGTACPPVVRSSPQYTITLFSHSEFSFRRNDAGIALCVSRIRPRPPLNPIPRRPSPLEIIYEVCPRLKSTRNPFPPSVEKERGFFPLIHYAESTSPPY